MRLVAKKMREEIEEMEEDKVDVRKEDKTIRSFTIPAQPEIVGEILSITSFTTMDPKTHKPKSHKKEVILKKRHHLFLEGPNGIGKTTLLESLAEGTAEGAKIADGVRVGYYRQDFSTLNFEHTVYESLMSIMDKPDEARITAARQDIQTIMTALRLYKLDNRSYPSSDQGLDALIKAPTVAPLPPAWKKGGYLDRLPKDPWGKEFQFLQPGLHGDVDIWSFGADNEPGGEGINADIGSWM